MEQTDQILGFEVEDGLCFGAAVVEMDCGGDAFVVGWQEAWEGGFAACDERVEVGVAGQGMFEDGDEPVAAFAVGGEVCLRIVDEEGVEDDAVGTREDPGVEDVATGGGEGTADDVEKPEPVPGADLDDGVAAGGLVSGVDGWREGVDVVVETAAQETMDEEEIIEDVADGMGLIIA